MALEKLAKTLVRKAGQAASKAQPFYSPIDEAIANITQGKGTGAQMLAELLKTKGVAKELKDRPAIKKALEAAKDTKVTKADVERLAAESPAAQIEEVTLGNGGNDRSLMIENRVTQDIDSIVDNPDDDFWFDELRRNYKNVGEMDTPERLNALERMMPRAEREREVRGAFESEMRQQVIDEIDSNVNFDDLSTTKFREYTIPGGENYREVLIKLPITPQKQNYASPHFEDLNILAHARVSDRVGQNGEKIMHVEEVQSDWHQAGRREGYQKVSPEENINAAIELEKQARDIEYKAAKDNERPLTEAESEQLRDLYRRAEELREEASFGVIDAPFKQNWHELVMKRLLDDAARNGYDKVVITPGAEQAKRYDLSRHVNEIAVPMVNENGVRSVRIDSVDGTSIKLMVDQNGVVTGYGSGSNQFTGKSLDEVIGKDMADKVMNAAPDTKFSGGNLQVGGEGMKGFYDQILPSFLNDYGKRYGARVGTYNIQESDIPLHSFDITPQMREEITTKGQPLYQVAPPVAIGAGAAMQEEEPTEYAGGGAVRKALKAVLPKGQQAVLPAAESAENLAKMLKPSVAKNRLYHGTQGYDDYADEQGQAFRQFSGRPTWLAEEPYTASGYSAGKGTTYPVYAQVKKPLALNFDANDDASKAFQVAKSLGVDLGWMKSMNNPEKAWEVVSHPSFIDAVEKAGYDGLMLNEGGYKTYGVFDPSKIKSAIGNRGTYDPAEADINKAKGGQVTNDAMWIALQNKQLRKKHGN
jgi:hypothetical protein